MPSILPSTSRFSPLYTLVLGSILAAMLYGVITYTTLVLSVQNTFADTSAVYNDANFKRANTPYLGKIGVALSLGVGLKTVETSQIPDLSDAVITLGEFIAQQQLGRNAIFVTNLTAQTSYIALLRTDINALLDQSTSRADTLESFIDQLNYRIRITSEVTSRLDAQGRSLAASIDSIALKINNLKTALAAAYTQKDPDKIQETLDRYLDAKQEYEYARTYLVFINRFSNANKVLNTSASELARVLTLNRDPLIKNTTVTIPLNGSDLLRQLDLINNESNSLTQR